MARSILKGELDFEREPWPRISDSAKSLVRQMLAMDPRKRLTARQVLGMCSCASWRLLGVGSSPLTLLFGCVEHPWLHDAKTAPNAITTARTWIQTTIE